MNMIKYYFTLLLLLTAFIFLVFYAHELIYEDGAYKKRFEILGIIWAAYIFAVCYEGVLL